MIRKTNFAGCRLIVFSIFLIVLGGCATMFAPSHDTVVIKSEPEGAEVFNGTQLLGKTPLEYSFKRDTFEQVKLSIRMHGWKSQELLLGRTLDTVSLWNFGYFFTTMGGTCWLIDASSGHMIKYSPNSYLLELDREGGVERNQSQGYLDRLRFVIVNHTELLKDISRGGGPYLTGYFELRKSALFISDYHSGLTAVLDEAPFFLTIDDPLAFFHELEKSSDRDRT